MDWDDVPVRAPRNRLTAFVGILTVVALLVGVTVIAFDRTEAPSGVPASLGSSKPPASTKPPTKTELDGVVAEISAFVARTRQLQFKRPVEVTLLDNEAFSARVKADAVEDIKELEETESVLHALGLLPDDSDLADILASFLGDSVVGFYDPKTDELVVRGAAITPYVRTTLAHELTHALDDQYYELHRPALDDADDESGTAFSALREGNAVRVEETYKQSLTSDQRDDADAEEARLGEGVDYTKIPRVLPELIGFPYLFGPDLVKALLAKGGEQRVDEALEKPPLTSEQVLDPAAWLQGGAVPVKVAPPKADGKVIDQGAFGLWGIYVLLEDEVGQQAAIDAAKGWGGDWYVAWHDGSKTCVRSTIVMDTPKDLADLGAALDDWSVAQDDATVHRTEGRVTFDVCG